MNNLPYSNKFKYGILGPAIILLAFGQATGELIHWPYLIVKYNYYFLFLLIPACFMQYAILYFLGRHTIITGESFLSTLIKSKKLFSIITWFIFLLTTIWISSYTNSGGIGIVKFCNKYFNSNVDESVWGNYFALGINTFFFVVLVFTKKSTYRVVNSSMRLIAILSFLVFVFLIVYSLFVKPYNTSFIPSLFDFKISAPSNWNPKDIKIIISAVVFAGLGGLWNLLYSGWVRNQKMGMAEKNVDEFIDYQSEIPSIDNNEENRVAFKKNMRLLNKDLFFGITLNFIMLLMLAYVCGTFWPYGKAEATPTGLSIVTVLADAASYALPAAGVFFYLFIGLFLIDTWLTAADSLSKVNANFILGLFPKLKKDNISSRKYYFYFLCFMWFMTIVTSYISQPQNFLYLNGILSSIGSLILIFGIFFNESFIAKKHTWLKANVLLKMLLILSLVFYGIFVYLYLKK